MSRHERGSEQKVARRRLEALGRRAAQTAHDVKNLLLVIDGLTERLLAHSEVGGVRGDLENIRRATGQAGESIRQLLELTHPRNALRPRVVHPNALLRRAEALMRTLVGEDILLHLDLGCRVGRIRVDPAQLEQALLNVVFNARTALPHGGEILIATDRVVVPRGLAALAPGPYSVIRISDDGVGMHVETLAKLFQPGAPGQGTQPGTGLGLSRVRAFVVEAGGDVRARSERGVGTTVELLLPEVVPPSSPSQAPDPPKRSVRAVPSTRS